MIRRDVRDVRWAGPHTSLYVWGAGSAAIVTSTTLLGLWATRKVAFYEILVLLGLTVCMWLNVPRRLTLSRRHATGCALTVAVGFAALTFLYQSYLMVRDVRLSQDTAGFLQSLWWTGHGLPLVNTVEEGTSHLGVHLSFFLFGLVPLYVLYPSPLVLYLAQSIGLATAGWLFFRLARRYLDATTSVCLLLVFLLYPPYQFLGGDFSEASLAAPFLVLAIDSGLQEKWKFMFVWTLVLLSIKETFGFVPIVFGCYLALRGQRRVGVMLAGVGTLWLALSLFVVMPVFSHAYALWSVQGIHNTFAHQALYSGITLGRLIQAGKVPYIISILAPYCFIYIFGSRLWIVALPELLSTLLLDTSHTPIYLFTGGRLAMTISVAVAVSAVLGLKRFASKGTEDLARLPRQIAFTMFVASLAVVPLWLNATTLYRTPVASAVELASLQQYVGAAASVDAPSDLVLLFAQRPVAFATESTPPRVIARCSQYVIMYRHYEIMDVVTTIRRFGFHKTWSGEVFELWTASTKPSCTAYIRPWRA